MYSFDQLVELFNEDESVIRAAIDLYVQRYGGSISPPYDDEMAGRLDEFFAIAQKANKSLVGVEGKLELSRDDAMAVENILGSQGIALLASAHAAREGRAIARLQNNIRRLAYNDESNRLNQDLNDRWEDETEWIEGVSGDGEAHKKILSRMGIKQESRDFDLLLEVALGKVSQKKPKTQPRFPRYWEDLI